MFTRHAGADCLGDFCCPVPSRSRGSIATQWGGQTEGQAAGGPPKPHFLGKNPNIFSLLKLPKLFPQVLVTGPLTLMPDRALRALIGLNSPDQPHLGLPPTSMGPGAYLSSSQGLHSMPEFWSGGAGLQPSPRCASTWPMTLLVWTSAYRLISWSLTQCHHCGPGCYFVLSQRVQDPQFFREKVIMDSMLAA